MPAVSKDRIYLQTGVRELEAYLLSKELYWPLSGPSDLPRMTIGGLLLAGKCLQARMAAGPERTELAGDEENLDATRAKWRAAWERKAGREVHGRLGLWRNYLVDYQHAPDLHADAYPQEVKGRVVLHLLAEEFPSLPADYRLLEDLDALLKSSWLPGAFVWERDLTPAFPEREYWFLYGRLKPS